MRSYKAISEKHPWRQASLCHSCSGNRAYLLHINCSELGSDASWVQDGISVCTGFKGNMSVTARDRLLLPKAKLVLKETKFCDNDISKKPQPNKKIPVGNSVSQNNVVPNCKSGISHIILFSKPSSFITVRKSAKKKNNLTLNAELQFLFFRNVFLPFYIFQNSLEYCPVLILLSIILFLPGNLPTIRIFVKHFNNVND